MNSTLEKIYLRSPPFFQNLMVSAYGISLYRQRYGGQASKFLSELRQSEQFSDEEMRKFNDDQFRRIARHAIENVPYYSTWARQNGVRPSDIRTLGDLSIFPILGKDDIRDNPSSLISNKAPKPSRLIALHTSGTTGTPLVVYCTRDERSYHYAFFSRLRSWYGLSPRSKRATFFGRVIMLPDRSDPPFWRHDVAQRNLIMSSYHLADRNLQHYCDKLLRYRPEELIGYPSALNRIASFMIENSIRLPSLKVAICTAETLLDKQREIMAAAFGCPIVNQYGCAEMAIFAAECEYGRMHVQPEHGVVETVDAHGALISGEPGSAVVTSFVNTTMPLIRYEIGDRLTILNNDCECGREFPVLGEIEGRTDDVIYRLDGTPVTRLSPVFKGNSAIREAQVIQNDIGNIHVLIVPEPHYHVDDTQWLKNEMLKRMGTECVVTIETVMEIPRTKSGKFRAVINNSRAKSDS